VVEKGDMEVPTKRGNLKVKIFYYTSNLKHSLMSTRKMLENDYQLVFEDRMCKFFDKNRRLVTIVKMNKNILFPLRFIEQGGDISCVGVEGK